MLLADWQINEILRRSSKDPSVNYIAVVSGTAPPPMIEPYIDHQVRDENGKKVISYGLTSAGYDIRVADEFKIFAPIPGEGGTAVDPKNFDSRLLHDFKGDVCEVPPHSYILTRSVEKFCIPRDIDVMCLGKSTYARCGIYVNVTPLEPGWRGYLTIEIANSGPSPVKIYANEGIAQLLFFALKGPANVSYDKREGKYQDQVGIVPPRMKE